jgi:hypothetical protein
MSTEAIAIGKNASNSGQGQLLCETEKRVEGHRNHCVSFTMKSRYCGKLAKK